jgi:hypothetical protein
MFISISPDGDLNLEDVDNMKVFSIVEAAGASDLGKAASALADIAEAAEDDHYWIDAEAVIQLSVRSEDPQWVENFWAMLKMVEAYGYSDLQAKRVKAHVETG